MHLDKAELCACGEVAFCINAQCLVIDGGLFSILLMPIQADADISHQTSFHDFKFVLAVMAVMVIIDHVRMAGHTNFVKSFIIYCAKF